MSPDRYDGHDSPAGQANRGFEHGTSARSVTQGNRGVAPMRHSYGSAGARNHGIAPGLAHTYTLQAEKSGKVSVLGNRGTKNGWRRTSLDSRMYHHEKGSRLDLRSSGFPHRKPWRFGWGTSPWSWPRAPSRPSPWPRPCLWSPPAPSPSLHRARSAGDPCPADSCPDDHASGTPFTPASGATGTAPVAGPAASLRADARTNGSTPATNGNGYERRPEGISVKSVPDSPGTVRYNGPR